MAKTIMQGALKGMRRRERQHNSRLANMSEYFKMEMGEDALLRRQM